VAAEVAMAVAGVEAVVASSAECARHVHPPSYHSPKGGDAQHVHRVQDDQHVQLVRQEGDGGPSVGGDAGADVGAGAVRGAAKLHCAQSPCEQQVARWACRQGHRCYHCRHHYGGDESVVDGADAGAGVGAGHYDAHGAARSCRRWEAAA